MSILTFPLLWPLKSEPPVSTGSCNNPSPSWSLCFPSAWPCHCPSHTSSLSWARRWPNLQVLPHLALLGLSLWSPPGTRVLLLHILDAFLVVAVFQEVNLLWESHFPLLRIKKGMTEDEWLGGITHSIDMRLSKLWEMVKDREAWLVAVHGITESDMMRDE